MLFFKLTIFRTDIVSSQYKPDSPARQGRIFSEEVAVLDFSVVDNSDFSPSRLTVHSDSPYAKETIPATHFKQRGLLWHSMSSCSCSWSSSSSFWRCYGVFPGSIFSIPTQEAGLCPQDPNVSSSPAPHTIAPPVVSSPLPRRL